MHPCSPTLSFPRLAGIGGRDRCWQWSRILSLALTLLVRAALLAAILRRALESGLGSWSFFTAGRFGCCGGVPTHLKSGSFVSGWGAPVLTQAWPPRETLVLGSTVNPYESANKRDSLIHHISGRMNFWKKKKQSQESFQC